MSRARTLLAAGLLAAGVAVTGLAVTGLAVRGAAAQSDITWYSLDFEAARLHPGALAEDGRRFALRREGGGRGALRPDPAAASRVLELATGPTPRGARHDRAELQVHSGIAWDRTWYLGLDVLVPRGTVFSDTWHVLVQCPQAGWAGSPPLSLDLEPDGRLALVARGDVDAYRSLWSAPMPAGRWVRVVLGFRMGARGHARLWLDGRRVADIRQPLGWAGGEARCVLKTGIYRGAAATPFTLRLDNILLGSSLRAVRPR